MSQYRRLYIPGSTYFFTVVTHKRKKILCTPIAIKRLRQAFKHVMKKIPFELNSIVILPDHIHCLWTLPDDDNNFSERWRLIKKHVSHGINATLSRRAEKHIWQRRYWEHLIRDEKDWRQHMDYINYNSVKHGYVTRPYDWPYGSFRRHVKDELYYPDWGKGDPSAAPDWDLE
tara:strand:- start:363 stop:881 length:519 start_codon:yes stop_codon:yes gene_type:complete